MPLKYDPDFFEVLKPLLPTLSQVPPLAAHDIDGRRQRHEAQIAQSNIPEAPGVAIEELKFQSFDGALITILRVYPTEEFANGKITPAYLHAHGGGMMFGAARNYINAQAHTVAATRIPMFSVDYRKAPEHPYPTPIQDAYAALLWIQEHASTFNIDPSRIGVTGESSGAGLAAGVLIYPMLDDRNTTPLPDVEQMAFWKVDDNLTGWTALLGEHIGKKDVSPYAAPARLTSAEGLPPIYADVGDLDIFKFEIIDYVQKFVKAGISAEFHLYPGLPHGWEGLAPMIPATMRAAANRNRALLDI
ncbi:hypothetical protein TrVFT333_009390 [Trichoderma virens FT-333]|nr:hypothetical protein TrVFT333_009390 [Trichoderma virens FT-333]